MLAGVEQDPAIREASEQFDPTGRVVVLGIPVKGQFTVVDIDLSILGRNRQDYDLFEERVRKEYKWVPGPLYRRKRIEVLESFLKRRTN